MNARLRTLVLTAIASCGLTMGAPYAHASNAAQNDFEVFMQKIRNSVKKNPSIDSDLAKFKDDGSFADVDYTNTAMTNWDPIKHIERLQNFAYAYTNPDNKHYQDEAVYDKIVKGLEYWYAQDPESDNWWHNQISEPQKIGVLLIQMRSGKKQVPEDIEAKTLERILKDGGEPEKWTGANRTDIALHWIYRSCLQRNEKDLAYALENVYNPVVYTTGEGFQHDNSNFQHGQQLYIGGYGDEILKGVTQVAMYTHGTRFAIPQDKLALLSKFMRETYYPTIRGKFMLFDVMGRSVSRPNVPDKSGTALFARRMTVLDPAHADEFKAIIARLEERQHADYALKPLHTHYFRGDYTLHVRPGYTFDVRMVSNRTVRLEYGNEENLKTYFISDGCTNIVRRGNEYDGIFPTWNWTRIPGVIAPQLKEIPMAASDWQCMGTSTFAGGVSDSLYGVTTYAYLDTYKDMNVGGHKAWFFFDDEVVCLGSDIQCATPEEVYTTVNQCIASPEGGLILTKGKEQAVPSKEATYKEVDGVLHDGVGYLFPQGGQIVTGIQRQSGDWNDINKSHKGRVEKDVFTLCLNHGKQPKGDKYAYIVVPGKQTAAELDTYRKEAAVEIVENTADLQAVHHKKLGIWQMVFYRPGTFKHKGLTVRVDRPCALMLKEGKATPVLHVADPGQTMQPIRIEVTLPGKKMQQVDFRPSDNAIYAGATQAFRL